MVECLSYRLAFMLTQEKVSQVYKTFSYSIREIIRNVFEHSLSESAWICGEYWPSRNNAQIAIMDEGIGILRSLKNNSNYSILKNDKEANNLALEAGVSCTLGQKQYASQIWQNSGYGLYMAKSLCLKGGFFILSSGEHTIFLKKHTKKNMSLQLMELLYHYLFRQIKLQNYHLCYHHSERSAKNNQNKKINA